MRVRRLGDRCRPGARFLGLCLSAGLGLWGLECPAQTVFLDFNTAGQYSTNFNPWNDSNGVNGGNYSFMESPTGGAGDSGEVSVFQSSDTTAAYKSGNWDFSTNGAAVVLSVLVKANGQTSGNKVQFGLLNSDTNGFNNNAGVAFESFRFVPASATSWSLREQYRTADTNVTETTLGTVTVAAGRWYKFVIGLTNTSGVTGNLSAACDVYDYGTDGLTPGTSIVTFSTLVSRTGQDIARTAAAFPAFRAFQDAGIDAWDNFLVYTPQSLPVFTLGLTNTTVIIGQTASFSVLADGPGTISYSWYTNGTTVTGASGPTYTTPPVSSDYTNVMVVAANANGATTNTASLTVLTAPPPTTNMTPLAGDRFQSGCSGREQRRRSTLYERRAGIQYGGGDGVLPERVAGQELWPAGFRGLHRRAGGRHALSVPALYCQQRPGAQCGYRINQRDFDTGHADDL